MCLAIAVGDLDQGERCCWLLDVNDVGVCGARSEAGSLKSLAKSEETRLVLMRASP